MTPGVTHHSIEAWLTKWRPKADPDAATAELHALVAAAVPTKRKSLGRDATIWSSVTADGEQVCLVVRDGTVVTVLAPRQGGRGTQYNVRDISADDEHAEESRRTREACRAMAAGLVSSTAEYERRRLRPVTLDEFERRRGRR